MLKEWIRGSSSGTESQEQGPKKTTRMVVEPEMSLDDTETAENRRRAVTEEKTKEMLAKGPSKGQSAVTYDSIFAPIQEMVFQERVNEVQEGIQVQVAKHAQNAMVTSKWTFGNPQSADWELNVQMNGFSDIVAASWSTNNRYQLMYQNSFSSGALFVMQAFAQKQGYMSHGSMFSMLQYPWSFHGCSQAQYVKDQSVSFDHLQRMARGLHIGSKLVINYSTPPNIATLTHAFSFVTPKKNTSFMGEINPSNGTWKLAAVAKDWRLNTEGVIQIDYKENDQGQKSSSFLVGLRRSYIGGATLSTALANFQSLSLNLQLPFGGQLPNTNQFLMQLKCLYDIRTGGLKHGITFRA